MTNEQLLTIIASLGGLILTATLALVGLILAQSRAVRSELRDVRSELHSGLREAARERTALQNHVNTQIGKLREQNNDLRDRLGRIEGYLDLLQQFFLRNGRGTAA